ncbi:MAG: nucleoside 2-deoxyribosyltransferase [Spirochaetales bacterium]|nr:nucleoside 2-deoxyribosyltransferase [Spirochaetales bacterium]
MKKVLCILICVFIVLSFAFGSAAAEESGKSVTRVYFAGPLFSQAERDYNLKLTKLLEDHGYEVFLPQRDGIEFATLQDKTPEEKNKLLFEKDVSEILKSDVVFFVLDGRVPDEGACVELGIGYANNKRCYGAKTDTRSAELDLELNPMISGCFIRLFSNYDGEKLFEEIDRFLSENEL